MIKSATIARKAMAYYYRYKEYEQAKARMQDSEGNGAEQHMAAIAVLEKQLSDARDAMLRTCSRAAGDYPDDEEER